MSNDTRASTGMAGFVAVGAVVVALLSIDWTQLAVDLFWSLADWVLGSFDRLVFVIAWLVDTIIN